MYDITPIIEAVAALIAALITAFVTSPISAPRPQRSSRQKSTLG